MKETNALIISKIKELLKKKRLTQKDLANEISVSKTTINNWLNNRSKIDVETLKKIAVFFKVPVAYFFDEDNYAKNQITNGNGNVQMNGVNNGSIKLSNAQHEIDKLKAELSGCRELLKSKNEIIEILKNK